MRDTAHRTHVLAARERDGILRDTLSAVGLVWLQTRVLHRRTNMAALLPPVHPAKTNPVDPLLIMQRVDGIVRAIAFWQGSKRCFYRTFATATLLRQRGVAAGIDFGLRLAGNRRRQCHCWVTIAGQPLGEDLDPRVSFPVPMGACGETVHYWLAVEPQTSVRP